MKDAYSILLEINEEIKQKYEPLHQAWHGSPFEWIIHLPSRTVGAVGEQIVHALLESYGFTVSRPKESTDYDREVTCSKSQKTIKLEIKFSTLWKNGTYVFQQIRNQDYDHIFCLGISPKEAHAWLIPKQVAIQNASPQHSGRRGSDTRWLHVNPQEVPEWLAPYGGSLQDAILILHRVLEEQ